MMQVRKPLFGDAGTATATIVATLDFGPRNKIVEVRLEGSIFSGQTPSLRDFLRDLACFPGNKWVMHLEELQRISWRALRMLATFAKVIRQRGHLVEVAGIPHSLYTTMLDLNLSNNFGWETIKDRPLFTADTSHDYRAEGWPGQIVVASETGVL